MQQEEAGGANQARAKREAEEDLVLAAWDCGSPLYDSFELASLHGVLESHLMVLPFPGPASRRPDHCAVAAPDVTDARACAEERALRRRGWRGSKAAAIVFRAVTCWKSL
ncbi:hypothetical protein ACP4OV_027537 [Aristida adscensionis]